jgi:invasion protein IalB
MFFSMRIVSAAFLSLICSATLVSAASAAESAKKSPSPARADTPRALGTFEAWTAAVHREGEQTVCYAFTRVRQSTPKLPGRGDVMLSVSMRPQARDVVAISVGYTYPPGAEVRLQVEKASFNLYTAQRSAFARDGHAVVQAMLKGREAIAHEPGPRTRSAPKQITDTFSLRGFQAAYAAILKACPAPR